MTKKMKQKGGIKGLLKYLLLVVLPLAILFHFVAKHKQKEFADSDHYKCIGKVTNNSYSVKMSTVVVTYFVGSVGYKKTFMLSMKAKNSIPLGYPFSITYAKNNHDLGKLDLFNFPDEYLAKMKRKVRGEVDEILMNKQYSASFKFRGFWEVFYSYSFDGKKYSGVQFFAEEPAFKEGDEYYVSLSEENPSIGFLDINDVYSEADIIKQIAGMEETSD